MKPLNQTREKLLSGSTTRLNPKSSLQDSWSGFRV